MQVEKRYENLMNVLQNKKYIDTELIQKAYTFACELHKGQKRKSGEDYIIHPIEVATILAELNFDENVVAAGLLHDVVEDTNCTHKDIKKKFNVKIANLVDSVTAIKEEKQEQNPEFYKFLMAEKTYNKLYSIGMSDKLSFYVKFADRLHNLRTIDVFPKYKQIEKVKETEKYLIPILQSIKASTLFYNIKNECYKIIEQENYEHFNGRYKDYLLKGKRYFHKTFTEFELSLNSNVVKKAIGPARLLVKQLKPYEIIEHQLPKLKVEPNKVKEFMFNNFVTHKVFIVLKNNKEIKNKHKQLFKLFSSSSLFSTFKIIGFFKHEKMQEKPMVVIDKFGNKMAVYLQTEKEHFQHNNGQVEGIEIPYDEELGQFEISENYIKVKTNTGKEILMPEYSTVLDFAFKVHNDFGFSVTGAYLNNSPNKVPIHTTLNNGDQVNLTIERDELTNECVYIAKIRWLSYAKTENAKKKLSKHFESMYED
jgi:GTP pyrophosphokinase